jgi:hypothetical protein
MKDTLSKIRQKSGNRTLAQEQEKDEKKRLAEERHAAAKPLIQAFAEIKDQPLRIDAMKRIWPDDFDRRDDRAIELVEAYLGGEKHPYGLRLRLPGGHRTFAVEQRAFSDQLSYVAVRESLSGAPHTRYFSSSEPWLDLFYEVMATVLEV